MDNRIRSLEMMLLEGAGELGVELSDVQICSLMTVLRELREWNQRMNLTAITDPQEIVVKHFLDSFSCARAVDFSKGGHVIDVGTGGGFPGIPLKIAFPQIALTLLDSVGKRLRYLDHITTLLQLSQTRTLHARAEDAARLPEHREHFDIVLARAVAGLPTLVELCLPFARPGGVFIAMKGPDVTEEVASAERAISRLGGIVREVKSVSLPYGGGGRSLVIVEKRRKTPAVYPRKAGIPSRQPLGG